MNTQGLYAYQIPAAEQLLAALKLHNAALDFSATGTGKTWVACAVARELDMPTLVVAPKISLTSWQRVGDAMGVGFCCKNWEALRTGTLPYGGWQFPRPKERITELTCELCQETVDPSKESPCRMNRLGIHSVSSKTAEHRYGRFTFHEGVRFIIWDEAHMAGGLDSLNASMVVGARRQNITSLFLSATAADSPLQLRALGYSLGLHALVGSNGFYPWIMRHGCRRQVWGGFSFGRSEEDKRNILSKIHNDLFPSRGVRIRISDIPNFPRCDIRAELYDVEESGKINELYAEMSESISLLNTMKLSDKCATHPLTCLLRASQNVELLKVPLYLALRNAALESGHAVALFVCYKQTLEELQKRMKCATVYGGQDMKERDQNIDAFQANRADTLVLNIAAGGISISLQDLHGKPRLGICSLHPSAVKMKQCFGRLARVGGLSPALYRIPLVANTVEEKTHRRLVSKLNNIDSLNDADMSSANLPLVTGDICEILTEALDKP